MYILAFTPKEAEKLQEAVDKLNEQQKRYYELGYNDGLAQGWRMGTRLMYVVIAAIIFVVWLVFNSPLR
jgi:hypothetical protein